MYVHDLNSSWMNHPFFGSSLKVESKEIIKKIIDYGLHEVYIDTAKGLDVADAPAEEAVEEDIQLIAENVTDKKNDEIIRPAPIGEEILRARKIKQETVQTVEKIMDDVKFGKEIEKDRVDHVVDNVIDSVMRNRSALVGLGRLRKVDEYVFYHSMSVCALMINFGKYLGFDTQLLKEVAIGAMLHDIGTTKVPSEILTKKRALSEEEYETIKKHVGYGREILEQTEGISNVSILTAYQHHERMDGSGYPIGLKGEEITNYGQAIAIVDVYDALTSKRCYKQKIPPTQALKILFERSGGEFNRMMVEKFIRCVGIYPVGSLVRLESGLLGIVIDHNEDNPLRPILRIVYNAKTNDPIVMPYDINLSQPSGKGSEDRVVSYEAPEKWNIQPEVYL